MRPISEVGLRGETPRSDDSTTDLFGHTSNWDAQSLGCEREESGALKSEHGLLPPAYEKIEFFRAQFGHRFRGEKVFSELLLG